jgi:hypothetical protein
MCYILSTFLYSASIESWNPPHQEVAILGVFFWDHVKSTLIKLDT